MADAQTTNDAMSPAEQAVEETKQPVEAPAPTATGNERIAILRHQFTEVDLIHGAEYPTARLELAIRNVSDQAIATAVFEAVFYDQEGKVIDTATRGSLSWTHRQAA